MLRVGELRNSFLFYILVFYVTATLLSVSLMATFGPTLMKTITHSTRQIVGAPDFGIISIRRGTCPCFDEGSIERAINSIQSGEVRLFETLSCKGGIDTDEDKIIKSVQLDSYPNDGQVQSDGVVQGKISKSKPSFLSRNTRNYSRKLPYANGLYYGYSSSSAKGLYKCHIGLQSMHKEIDSIDYVDCKIIIDDACSRLTREKK